MGQIKAWLGLTAKGRAVTTDGFVYLLVAIDLLLLACSVIAASGARIVALAAIVAASAVGALVGLLFAVPKRDPSWTRQPGEKGTAYRPNSSLEDVSDWLTKTIIGVGLVQLSDALRRLDASGRLLGSAVFGTGTPSALPGGVALLVGAAALGGLAGYIWFYAHLPTMFDEAFAAPPANLSAAGLVQAKPGTPPGPPPTEAFADATARATLFDADDPLDEAVRRKDAQLRTAPQRLDDWCKGMFGGRSRVETPFGVRALSVRVTTVSGSDSYRVNVALRADHGDTPARAVFFLHNTFPQTMPTVSFGPDGVARLELFAWGAFTIGALTDDGSTELELDLGGEAGAPAGFRAR